MHPFSKTSNTQGKRWFNENKKPIHRKRQRKIISNRSEGTHEEVLLKDISVLLQNVAISTTPESPEFLTELEVSITALSSTGDGLGQSEAHPGRVFVVPFTVPGDVVLAKSIRNIDSAQSSRHTITDFIKLLTSSPSRLSTPAPCPNFEKCSGCQFQMLPYDDQLKHKRTVIEKAYRNFSGLAPSVIPDIAQTIGSPLIYGYRTKLTPHFDGPPGGRSKSRKGEKPAFEHVPPIGFIRKGTRRTLDIEECPIATDAVQAGLERERERVKNELSKYTKGATLLLRESTKRVLRATGREVNRAGVYGDHGDYDLVKDCITDNTATSTEYVGDLVFENEANSFFQNNNSILPAFTNYIRDHALPSNSEASAAKSKIRNLIDAYCGSGLFTVSLASLFEQSVGIDIDEKSISYARRNAQLNGLVPDSAGHDSNLTNGESRTEPKDVRFIAADAAHLFKSVSHFEPSETVIVIDPPRKGCDENFLRQLLDFGPRRIVYVSCNVHTQARDVGWILHRGEDAETSEAVSEKRSSSEKLSYVIESIVGFDFFPQTSHVESVAVLRRVSSTEADAQIQE